MKYEPSITARLRPFYFPVGMLAFVCALLNGQQSVIDLDTQSNGIAIFIQGNFIGRAAALDLSGDVSGSPGINGVNWACSPPVAGRLQCQVLADTALLATKEAVQSGTMSTCITVNTPAALNNFKCRILPVAPMRDGMRLSVKLDHNAGDNATLEIDPFGARAIYRDGLRVTNGAPLIGRRYYTFVFNGDLDLGSGAWEVQ